MAQKADKQGTGVEFHYKAAEKCYALYADKKWYPAVIRNVGKLPETGTGSASYFVHYHGWNERFNEWIYEDCLMKADEKSGKKAKEQNDRVAAGSKNRSKASPQKGTKKAPRSRENTLNIGGEGTSAAVSRSESVVSESASDATEDKFSASGKRQGKNGSQSPAEPKKVKTQTTAAGSTLASTPTVNPAAATSGSRTNSAAATKKDDILHAAQSAANSRSNNVFVSTGNNDSNQNEDAYAPLAFAAHAAGVLQALQKNRNSEYRHPPTDITLYGKKHHTTEDFVGVAQIGDGGIPAHKCVLETQSLFFAGRYAYTNSNNNSENKLELDIDQDILRFIIDFMYTGKVPDFERDFPGKSAADCCQRLLLAAKSLRLTSSSAELLKFCHRWQLKPPISVATCLSQLLYAAKYGLPGADSENYRMLNRAMMFFAAAMPEIMDTEEFSNVNGVYMWRICEMVRNKYGQEVCFDLGDRKMCIKAVTMCGNEVNVMCSRDCSVKKLKSMLREACDFFVSARIVFEGKGLGDSDTLRDSGVETGDVLDLFLEQVGCTCKCSASKAEEMWAKTSSGVQDEHAKVKLGK